MGKVHIISVLVAATFVGLVLGLSSYNEQAEAGGTISDPCDSFSGVLQHWDKIIFQTDRKLIHSFEPTILPILHYDIKVQQDPFFVTNLEKTVRDFLNANGYTTTDKGKVRQLMIDIVDVEYDIACISTGIIILPPGDFTDSTST